MLRKDYGYGCLFNQDRDVSSGSCDQLLWFKDPEAKVNIDLFIFDFSIFVLLVCKCETV